MTQVFHHDKEPGLRYAHLCGEVRTDSANAPAPRQSRRFLLAVGEAKFSIYPFLPETSLHPSRPRIVQPPPNGRVHHSIPITELHVAV
jgi:hypothetical protein